MVLSVSRSICSRIRTRVDAFWLRSCLGILDTIVVVAALDGVGTWILGHLGTYCTV